MPTPNYTLAICVLAWIVASAPAETFAFEQSCADTTATPQTATITDISFDRRSSAFEVEFVLIGASSIIQSRDVSTLELIDQEGISGFVAGLSEAHPFTGAFATLESGSVLRIGLDSFGEMFQDWIQPTFRAGCGDSDSFDSPPVVHRRSQATPAFQARYDEDLVYAGTAYGCGGATSANRVYALESSTGGIQWLFNAGGFENLNRVVGMVLDQSTDRLYVATEQDSSEQPTIRTLDVLTGVEVWSANVGENTEAPVLESGRLYTGNLFGEVHALDPSDGSVLWSKATSLVFTNPLVAARPTNGGSTHVVTADSFNEEVVAVRDEGGSASIAWQRALPNGAAPTSVAEGVCNRVLVSDDDGVVHEFDLSTGDLISSTVVDTAGSVTALASYDPRGFGADGAMRVFGATDSGTLAKICTRADAGEFAPVAPEELLATYVDVETTETGVLELDPVDGTGALVGDPDVGLVHSLATHPDGRLFGVNFLGLSLLRFDRASTCPSHVARILGIDAIAFDSAGTLFGHGRGLELVTIDPETGEKQVIGPSSPEMQALAFDPIDGRLFGASADTAGGNVHVIDPSSGATSLLGPSGLAAPIRALHFDSRGELYGVASDGDPDADLVTIDKATGAATVVGSVGFPNVLATAVRLPWSTTAPEGTVATDQGPGLRVSPNPTRAQMRVDFTLPERPSARLEVFDVRGRRLDVLVDGRQGTGAHTTFVDTRAMARGVYYLRLVSGEANVVRKFVVLER